MKLSRAVFIGVACAALLFTGCSTTQTRISDHPEIFQSLSAQDQALVQQGQIRVGMPMNGVWLAWGPPNQKGAGRNGSHPIETWIYWGTTDAGYGPFYGGFGFGYGGFGYLHRGGFYHRRFFYDPFYDPFFYSRVNMVQYPERFVSFENGRVVAYSHLPAPRVF